MWWRSVAVANAVVIVFCVAYKRGSLTRALLFLVCAPGQGCLSDREARAQGAGTLLYLSSTTKTDTTMTVLRILSSVTTQNMGRRTINKYQRDNPTNVSLADLISLRLQNIAGVMTNCACLVSS